MCDQTQVEYKPGDVVWFKISNVWWPAQVQDESTLDDEVTRGLKKKPFAIVKFFNEDLYEFVKDINQICHYNSYRKFDFIKKGLDAFRAQGDKNKMNKFPGDVILAEEFTGGNVNILDDPRLAPEEKINYNELFSSTKKNGKNVKTKSKNSLAKTKLFMGSTSSPLSFKQDLSKSNSKNYFTEVRLQKSIDYFPLEYKCDACGFLCSRITTLSAHKAYNKQNSCANKSPLKFSKTQSTIKFEKYPIKRKSLGNDDSIKKKPKVSLKGVAPESKKVKSLVKETKDKKKSEAMREQLLLDWNEEDADDNSDGNSPKNVEKGENKSESSNKVNKDLINKTSCFDFEDNDEDININSPYRFGQKLPRITVGKEDKTKSKESKYKDIKSTNDEDNLEKEFNDIMKETSVPVVQIMTDSFLLDSSALPVDISTGKAEANLGSINDETSKKVKSEDILSLCRDSLESKHKSTKANNKYVHEEDNSSLLRTLESDSPAEDDISTNSSIIHSGKRSNPTMNEESKKKLKRDTNFKQFLNKSVKDNNNSLISDKSVKVRSGEDRTNDEQDVTTSDVLSTKSFQDSESAKGSICQTNSNIKDENSSSPSCDENVSKKLSSPSSRSKSSIHLHSSLNSNSQCTEEGSFALQPVLEKSQTSTTSVFLEKTIDNIKSKVESKRRDSIKKDSKFENKEKINEKKINKNTTPSECDVLGSDSDKKNVLSQSNNKTGNEKISEDLESKKNKRKLKKANEDEFKMKSTCLDQSNVSVKSTNKDQLLQPSDIKSGRNNSQKQKDSSSLISNSDSKSMTKTFQDTSDLSPKEKFSKTKIKKSSHKKSCSLTNLNSSPQSSEKPVASSKRSSIHSKPPSDVKSSVEIAGTLDHSLAQGSRKGSTESLKMSSKKSNDSKQLFTVSTNTNDLESQKSKSVFQSIEMDHSQKLSANKSKRKKSTDHKLLKSVELSESPVKSPKKRSPDHKSPEKFSNINSQKHQGSDQSSSKKSSHDDDSLLKLPSNSRKKILNDQSSPKKSLPEESPSKKKSSDRISLTKSSVEEAAKKISPDQISPRKTSLSETSSKKVSSHHSSPRKLSVDETSSKRVLTDPISPRKASIHDTSKKRSSDRISPEKKSSTDHKSSKKVSSSQNSVEIMASQNVPSIDEISCKKVPGESTSLGKMSLKSNDNLSTKKLFIKETSLEKLSANQKCVEKNSNTSGIDKLSGSPDKLINVLKSQKLSNTNPSANQSVKTPFEISKDIRLSEGSLDQITLEKTFSSSKSSKTSCQESSKSSSKLLDDANASVVPSPTCSVELQSSNTSLSPDHLSHRNLPNDMVSEVLPLPDKSTEKLPSEVIISPDKGCKKSLNDLQPSTKLSDVLKSSIHPATFDRNSNKRTDDHKTTDKTYKSSSDELSDKYSNKLKESSTDLKSSKTDSKYVSQKSKDEQDSHSRSSDYHKYGSDSHSSKGESSSRYRASSSKSHSYSSSSKKDRKDHREKRDHRREDKYRSRKEHDSSRDSRKKTVKEEEKKKSNSQNSSLHHTKKEKKKSDSSETTKSSLSSPEEKVNKISSFIDSFSGVNKENIDLKKESTSDQINANICSTSLKKESLPSSTIVEENKDNLIVNAVSNSLLKDSKIFVSENSSSNDGVSKEMEEIFSRKNVDENSSSRSKISDKESEKKIDHCNTVSSVEETKITTAQNDIINESNSQVSMVLNSQESEELKSKTIILSPISLDNKCETENEPLQQITVDEITNDAGQMFVQKRDKIVDNLLSDKIEVVKKSNLESQFDAKSDCNVGFNQASSTTDISEKIMVDEQLTSKIVSNVKKCLTEECKLDTCFEQSLNNETSTNKVIDNNNPITSPALIDMNLSSENKFVSPNNKLDKCIDKKVELDIPNITSAANYTKHDASVEKNDPVVAISETSVATCKASAEQVDSFKSLKESTHTSGMSLAQLKFDFNEPDAVSQVLEKNHDKLKDVLSSPSQIHKSSVPFLSEYEALPKSSNESYVSDSAVELRTDKSTIESNVVLDKALVEESAYQVESEKSVLNEMSFSDDSNSEAKEPDFNSKFDIASEVVISSEPDDSIVPNTSKNPSLVQSLGSKSFSDIKLNLQLSSSLNLSKDSLSNIQDKLVSSDFLTPDKIKEIFRKVQGTHNSPSIRPIIVPPQIELEEKPNSQPVKNVTSSSDFTPSSCVVATTSVPSQELVVSDVQNMEFDINSMPFVIADSSEIISPGDNTTPTPVSLPHVLESVVPASLSLPSDSKVSNSLTATEQPEKPRISCIFVKLTKPNTIKPGPGYQILHIPRRVKPQTPRIITQDMIKLKPLSSHILQKSAITSKLSTDGRLNKIDGNRIFLVSKSGKKTFLINERTALLNHFSPKDLIVTIPSSEAGTSGKSKGSEINPGSTKKIHVGNPYFIQNRVIITNKNQTLQSSNLKITSTKSTNLLTQKKLVGICKAPDAPESSSKKVVRFKDPEVIKQPLRTNTILTSRRRTQLIEPGAATSNTIAFNVDKPHGAVSPSLVTVVNKSKDSKLLKFDLESLCLKDQRSEKVYPVIKTNPHQDILAKALADTQVLQSESDQTTYIEQPACEGVSGAIASTVSIARTVMSTAEVPTRGFSSFDMSTVYQPNVLEQSSMPLLNDELQSQTPVLQLDASEVILSGNVTKEEGIVEAESLQSSDSSSAQLTANVDLAEIELPPGCPPDSSECHDISSIPLPPEPYMGNRALISSPSTNNVTKQLDSVSVPQFPSNPVDSIHSSTANS